MQAENRAGASSTGTLRAGRPFAAARFLDIDPETFRTHLIASRFSSGTIYRIIRCSSFPGSPNSPERFPQALSSTTREKSR